MRPIADNLRDSWDGACSSVRIEQEFPKLKVAGSSPARPTTRNGTMATTKRINRKELDQDEFLEKVFDLGEWLEANWKQAAGVAIGAVAVVLLGLGWNAWRGRTLNQANVALGQGLELYAPQPKADGTAPPPKMA